MIRLYNVLTRKKQTLSPIRKDWVGLYTCGPTVYNFAHIGNLRTYIFEDILRRTIESEGLKVRQVMNITDVDDKIIRNAAQTKKTIADFVRPYESAFYDDLAKLHIKKAWKYPKATSHIREMIRLVEMLLKKGIAYRMDGSVYFSIAKFKTYGALSRVASRELKAGVRLDADEYTKESVQDFVLWKDKKETMEPSWPSPFGEGRPGWHLECSAMSMKYLGETFDIHAGGVDLIFPHHENEIAQSEAATGKQFAHFFVEGEYLMVNGEKMSKSLGNVYTLRDIETKKIDPLAFRYLTLTAHYRAKLNFTWESLGVAAHSLERLREFGRELAKAPHARRRGTSLSLVSFEKRFDAALADDLETPAALAVVWSLINRYRKNPEKFDPKKTAKLLANFDTVLGLSFLERTKIIIPKKIKKLAAIRATLRNEKKWAEADALRLEMEQLGWIVKDTLEGPELKQKK